LIEGGKLDARIDLEHETLVALEHDSRAEAQQEALDMVEAFTREARMKLIRLQAVNAGLEIKPLPRKKGWDTDADFTAYDDSIGGNVSVQSATAGPGGRDILAAGSGYSQRKGG
jgi:hypothetical protein